jgi:hypothetical protein
MKLPRWVLPVGACLIVFAGPFRAVAQPAAVPATPLENLALNRPYVCSDEILAGWTGLTDGVTDSDSPPGCFATGPSDRFPKLIIIDLGALCTISKINVTNSKNGNTRHVGLFVSADAATYEQLRDYIFPGDAVQTLAHSFTARKARYVKIALYDSWEDGAQGPNCLFLREVQVFGQAPAEGPSANGREELRLAHIQPQLTTTSAVGLFRRYGLTGAHHMHFVILGDDLMCSHDGGGPWDVEIMPRNWHPPGEMEFNNLSRPDQSPAEGLAIVRQLTTDASGTPDVILVGYGHDAALAGQDVTDFRNAFQGLLAGLADTPALVVVVTPPPLLQETDAAHSVLPYAQAEEQIARQYGLPVVRGAAVLAASPDPLGCYTGSDLTGAGQFLIAQAVQRLLWGADSPSPSP